MSAMYASGSHQGVVEAAALAASSPAVEFVVLFM